MAFFFSLRPQEVVALTKEDFAMGLRVLSFEASRSMILAGLDDGIVVNITKQFSKGVGICAPKWMSTGVIPCLNDAARIQIEHILDTLQKGHYSLCPSTITITCGRVTEFLAPPSKICDAHPSIG